MKHLFIACTMCAGVYGSSLFASAQTPQVWTYSDCVEYARENNISLQKARLNAQTQAVNLSEAEAAWQPTLDFATSHSYTNSPWGKGDRNSYNSSYGFNAGWSVYNGGIRENTIRRDRILADAATLNTDALLRDIKTDILSLYLNILYARESIDICSEAEQVSLKQADRARQLMEAGRLSRVDYARLQSQYEQDRYATVNARSTYDSRCMELKQLLELPVTEGFTLADISLPTDAILTDSLPSLAESCTLAEANDISLQVLIKDLEASGYDVKIANGAKLPKIDLNAGVGTGYYAPGTSFGTGIKQGLNEQIGLQLSIPIFDAKKTRSAVERAKINELDAALDIENRRNTLAREVESTFIDTRSAQARYQAGLAALDAASIADTLSNEQFALGYVNIVELLTAHNSLIEARHELLQAKYMTLLGLKMIEYYRTANITLL